MDANYLRNLAAKKKQEKLLAEQAAQNSTRSAAGNMVAAIAALPAAISAPTAPAAKSAIEWNEEQLRAIELATAGKEFCLIGAAGTGKTTTVKEVIRRKLESLCTINAKGEKQYPAETVIGLVSYTNRAVRNIAKAVQEINATHHCKTIHKFLRYRPERVVVIDDMGNEKNSMIFVPTHTGDNPISECQVIVCDESSMIDTNLHKQLKDATPNASYIYIGDLNQLPPVFGDAILGYKLAELPVVELTRVYRQAMDSPIIAFQHNFTLKGKMPSDTDLKEINAASESVGRGLFFRPLKKFIEDGEIMAKVMATYLMQEMDAGQYEPESGNHVVLVPFNKQFGTIEINRWLSQFLGDRRKAEVYEVISGIAKHYFAVGDLVAYNKREWRITAIRGNGKYFGKLPKEPSVSLNRFGHYTDGKEHEVDFLAALDKEFAQAESLLAATSGFKEKSAEGEEDIKNQASHMIDMVAVDDETLTCVAATAGEVNSIQFAYCTTIHKSQGSEWDKVYLITTRHHNVMISRELLYTGMTRAKRDLVVIYSPQSAPGRRDNSLAKAIARQEIPGTGWKSKVEYFKGKIIKNSGGFA